MVNFVILALVLALGRSRYRWRAARQEAADQLARAEADSRSAATAERQRLARELHDVAAHHLTSIVVTAAAAERLPGQPELLTQALTFTANTGRETLAALHRLVAVMDVDTDRAPPLLVRVAELADGFVRLGQPVTVQADGDVELVPPAVAEAVYGIVREALTNALRYAPGAAVTVRLAGRPETLELTIDDEGVACAGSDAPLGLMTLLLVAHGLPLLWRRQARWRVLAAVALANCLWPVAVALKLLSPTSTFIAPGAFAACAAVYSVALWGRPDWATWISIPVAVLAITTSTATGLVLDPTLADQPPTTETVLFVGVGMAICAGPEILAVWGAGMAVRLRRGHTIQREHGALAVAATRAAYAALIERSRIAAGLRDSVLDLASSLTTTADAGRQALADGSPAAARERLTEASTQARAALAAMRELLEMLHSNHLPADRSPQPTAASIEQLCQHQRSIGRPVILHTSGAPLGLPAEVGVSAYRIVAAALGAGDRGPAEVTLMYCRDDLRISVSGVPAATVGPIAAGLRERVAAFGGRIALSRNNGTVDVVLPARVEEVTPSPSA